MEENNKVISGTDYACASMSKVACALMAKFHKHNERWPTEEELFKIMKDNYKQFDLNKK